MSIKGLVVEEDFLTEEQEASLVKSIDAQSWQVAETGSDRRRVQQYGYQYVYTGRDKTPPKTTPIPDWLSSTVLDRLSSKLFPAKPDQVIVNEYRDGNGIHPHIDHVRHFGPTVCSVSLLSDCVMTFTAAGKFDDDEKRPAPIDVVLKQRSVVYLSDDARYYWKHEIKQTDASKNRLSITCRTMRSAS
jgi:alkylated DNA repair dioxygenase AlkB